MKNEKKTFQQSEIVRFFSENLYRDIMRFAPPIEQRLTVTELHTIMSRQNYSERKVPLQIQDYGAVPPCPSKIKGWYQHSGYSNLRN